MTLFCKAVNCGNVPAPNFGTVQVTSLQLNGIATYTCLNGFKLIGAATRTCQTDGTWSGSAPTCQGKATIAQMRAYMTRALIGQFWTVELSLLPTME